MLIFLRALAAGGAFAVVYGSFKRKWELLVFGAVAFVVAMLGLMG